MNYAIAGVAILPLILGVVEFAKQFGLKGKGATLLSVILGIVFGGLVYAFQEGMIPEAAAPWIQLGVFALAFGLAASGLYDLGKRWSGNGK